MKHLPGKRIAVDRAVDLPRTIAAAWWLLGPARRHLVAAARSGDRSRRHDAERRWARHARAMVGIDLRIDGAAAVDPTQAYVVAPLHEGFADALALLHLPLDLSFVLRRELLQWPHLGEYLRVSHHIVIDPEDRIGGVPTLVEAGRRRVAAGDSIVMFPQGSVIGIEAAFQPGAAWLARMLDVPVLPIVVAGTHRVWEQPFTPRLRFRQPVFVEVLDPVEPAELASLETEMKDRALTNGHAEPRRFDPEVDGFWDGYAYEIDPTFSELAAVVARHRAQTGAARTR